MHELSIALSIIEGATEEAAKHDHATVEAVHLKLGALSGVGQRRAALFVGNRLSGNRARKFAARNRSSSRRRSLRELSIGQNTRGDHNLVCPACELPTPQIISGKELLVTALEIS